MVGMYVNHTAGFRDPYQNGSDNIMVKTEPLTFCSLSYITGYYFSKYKSTTGLQQVVVIIFCI